MSSNQKNELENFLISQAIKGKLPDKLGLNDVCELLFFHEIEEFKKTHIEGFHFDICLKMFGFNFFVNEQIELGRILAEGYTKRKLTHLGPETQEPIVTNETIKNILEIVDVQLETNCILFSWIYGSIELSTVNKRRIIDLKLFVEHLNANAKKNGINISVLELDCLADDLFQAIKSWEQTGILSQKKCNWQVAGWNSCGNLWGSPERKEIVDILDNRRGNVSTEKKNKRNSNNIFKIIKL